VPGKSLGAKPRTVAATPASPTNHASPRSAPALPPPAGAAALGLQGPDQAPSSQSSAPSGSGSSGSGSSDSSAQQSQPAPQPSAPAPAPVPAPAPSGGGGPVVSGGS
jgi:2-oxoglutarate dehydrogenase E2 component (dihydrolipoamide succinyltransferase)